MSYFWMGFAASSAFVQATEHRWWLASVFFVGLVILIVAEILKRRENEV